MDIEITLHKIEELPFSNEKILLTENLFHITFWTHMNINQKVRLLQLLENNISALEGRKPSEIVVIPKLPNFARASLESRKIKISQWHLEFGISYLKDMNAQSYCAILHEHDHISKFIDSQSDKKNAKLEECRNNFANLIPYSAKNISEYVNYRFQPIEYYAHKISEEKTIKTFERLEIEFGKDKGFKAWYEAISNASVDNLVSLYNQEYSTNYTFDNIYKNILEKISQTRIKK